MSHGDWVRSDRWVRQELWRAHEGPAPAPTAIDLGLEVWQSLGSTLTSQDAAAGGVALALLRAAMAPLTPVERIVRDLPDSPGWSRELDPSVTERPRWAAQFAGDTPPAGLTDARVRQRLGERPHQRRGHPSAIAAAVRPLLRGSRSVEVFERDGSAYRVRVRTYGEETPDIAAANAALQAAKPAGLVLVHEVVTLTSYAPLEQQPAQTYGELEQEPAATYQQLET